MIFPSKLGRVAWSAQFQRHIHRYVNPVSSQNDYDPTHSGAQFIPVEIRQEQRSRFFPPSDPPSSTGIEATSNFFDERERNRNATGVQTQQPRPALLRGFHQFVQQTQARRDAQPPLPVMPSPALASSTLPGTLASAYRMTGQQQPIQIVQASPVLEPRRQAMVGAVLDTRQTDFQLRSSTPFLRQPYVQNQMYLPTMLLPVGHFARQESASAWMEGFHHPTEMARVIHPGQAAVLPTPTMNSQLGGIQMPSYQIQVAPSNAEDYSLQIRAAKLRLESAKLELAHFEKLQSIQTRDNQQTEPNLAPSAVDVIRKTNNKGKNLNIYDGYAYKSDGAPNSKGTQYFSCIKKHGRKCKLSGGVLEPPCRGRMIKYEDGTMKFKGIHDCIRIPNLERRREFLNVLCEAAKTQSGGLKEIYDTFVPKYHDVAPFMRFEPNVRKNMYCHRRQVQRAFKCRVKNMKQLHDVLQTEEGIQSLLVLEDFTGQAPRVEFETITVWVENEKKVKEPYIIFVDKVFLGKVKGGLIMHVDSTFGSRMNIDGLRQLLTIMVRTFDKAFPVIWVNMPMKTTKAYIKVFEVIKKLLGFQPKKILTDYEIAEQNALRTVFGPDVEIVSCFFHWKQAVWKNALQYGVAYAGMSRKEPEKFEVIRKIMALPLLPEEDIIPTFKIIREEASQKFGCYFERFCELYIEGYWLDQRTPATICVYNQLIRTNNDEETYHRDLNSRFRHIRPAVKNFWWVMLHFVQLQYSVLEGQKQAFSSGQKNQISLFNEKLLLENWAKLNKTLSPIDFVTICANEMKRFLRVRDDININASEVGTEKGHSGTGAAEDVIDDDATRANDEDDPVGIVNGVPLSDEGLADLIQTLDDDVIFGDATTPEPLENSLGSTRTDAIDQESEEGASAVDATNLDEHVGSHQTVPTRVVDEDFPAREGEHGKDIPASSRVPEDSRRQTKKRGKKEAPKKNEKSAPTFLRAKRIPKPKTFDDYVVPTKKQRIT